MMLKAFEVHPQYLLEPEALPGSLRQLSSLQKLRSFQPHLQAAAYSLAQAFKPSWVTGT